MANDVRGEEGTGTILLGGMDGLKRCLVKLFERIESHYLLMETCHRIGKKAFTHIGDSISKDSLSCQIITGKGRQMIFCPASVQALSAWQISLAQSAMSERMRAGRITVDVSTQGFGFFLCVEEKQMKGCVLDLLDLDSGATLNSNL
jgi:hypothetical protein